MAKHIYLNFENDKVVAISLNMSDDHLLVYSNKFNIDMSFIKEMKDIKVKLIYINIDSEYVIGYQDKSNKVVYYPAYAQFIRQNKKESFLSSLKPLGTPRIPKAKTFKSEKTSEDIQEIEFVEIDKIDDIDSLLKEKELLESKISKMLVDMESELIYYVENEDFEKAAELRDKINKLK
jgi:hypothetical protein